MTKENVQQNSPFWDQRKPELTVGCCLTACQELAYKGEEMHHRV